MTNVLWHLLFKAVVKAADNLQIPAASAAASG